MPNYYYDVLSLQELEIDKNTILYLVRFNEKFFIKAISCNINQLSKDPTTRADKYWLINTEQLLAKSANNLEVNKAFFRDNMLTTEAIPLTKITEYIGFNPEKTTPLIFNTPITRQIVEEVNQGFINDEINFSGNFTSLGIHSLFANPSSVESTHQMDNEWHNTAYRELRHDGLTPTMLLSRHENGHTFTDDHCYALITLVRNRDYTVENALLTIDGLSSPQAHGIKEGLDREDVIHLSNYWYIAALEKLKSYGLTAAMLLNRNEQGHYFGDLHSNALINLVQYRGYTIGNALLAIDGLSNPQAGGIENGLDREDVIHLSNFWHILALTKLKPHGLTATMLINRNEHGHEFNENHYFALANLVSDRNYTVENALLTIDGLSSPQAKGIKEGLDREDVIHLSNYWYIAALEKLKSYGLTTAILLNLNEQNHEFKSDHYHALIKLVVTKHYSIETALQAINGLSSIEANYCAQTAETRSIYMGRGI